MRAPVAVLYSSCGKDIPKHSTHACTGERLGDVSSPARPNAYEMRPTIKESEFPVAAAADTLMPASANVLAYS